MTDLHLNLKAEYFDDIESENKAEEYRLCTPHFGDKPVEVFAIRVNEFLKMNGAT